MAGFCSASKTLGCKKVSSKRLQKEAGQKGWSFFAKMKKKAVKKWLSFAASEVKNALWLGLRWWLGKLKEQSAEKNLQPTIEAPPKTGANQYPTGQKGYQTFWKRPKGQLDKFLRKCKVIFCQLSYF